MQVEPLGPVGLGSRRPSGLSPVVCVMVGIATFTGARFGRPVPGLLLVLVAAVVVAVVAAATIGTATIETATVDAAPFDHRGSVGRSRVGAGSLATVTTIGLFILGSGLSARSLAGLEGLRTRTIDERAVFVTDPRARGPGVVADVVVEQKRYEASFFGAPAGAAVRLAVGDSLHLVGAIEPFTNPWPGHRARHVIGRITVDWAWGRESAGGHLGWANAARSALDRSFASLGDDERAIALGVAVGDDRALSDDTREEFRDAGLSHLTAVSGQNVAFVMAMVAPMLRRRGRWARLAVVIAVLGWFGTITRWEPSVLRAIATATFALVLSPDPDAAPRLSLLGLVVSSLLLIDPMLAWSVGFQLSVGATIGIVVMAERISERLGGPLALRRAAGVTLAAQLGVLPVQAAVFGPPSLAAVPANLLAGPVAGVLMTSVVAGGGLMALLPALEPVAVLPARLGAWWLLAVADVAARQAGSRAFDLAIGCTLLISLVLGHRRSRSNAGVA